MVAYGVDMRMIANGKVNNLVELMSQVFFSCTCPSLLIRRSVRCRLKDKGLSRF